MRRQARASLLSLATMTHDIKVIRATDFVRARAEGEFDLARSEELLEEIVRATAALEDFEILVDTRKVPHALRATDLWFLVETLVKHRRTFDRKMAVLCPETHFDHARFFSLCAERRGFNIQPFTEYEEAMDWLTSESA
jgi:hypothetical protein